MCVGETGWQWWRYGIKIVVTLVFCLHVYTLLWQFWAKSTASSFTLVDDTPPRMPAITVCPPLPFPVDTLIDFGIDTSCDNYEDCLNAFFNDVHGFPHNVSVQDLWDASLLPLSTYIHSTSIYGTVTKYHSNSSALPHWKPSMTSLGHCWTLVPPKQNPGEFKQSLTIYIKNQIPCSVIEAGISYLIDPTASFPRCRTFHERCKESCAKGKVSFIFHEIFNEIIIMLHEPREPPSLVDAQNTLLIYDGIAKDTSVKTWVFLRETNLLESPDCDADPVYSFSRCMALCREKHVGKSLDCFSHPMFYKLAKKEHIKEYMIFRLNILKSLRYKIVDPDTIACMRSCKTPCKYTQYDFITNYLENNYYTRDKGETTMYEFTLQISAPFTESIVEEVIYTSSRLLSDLGGSLGLCFGFGLLTLHKIVYNTLVKLYLRWKNVSNKFAEDSLGIPENHTNRSDSHFRRIWMICGTNLLLIAFGAHSLHMTASYLEYQKVSVSNLRNKPVPFPGVTLCPDVPFDLPTLSKHGLNALNNSELEKECHKKGKCDRDVAISYLLNTLPGLWESNLTLDTIWNFTRPFDALVTEYAVDDINYDGEIKEIITSIGKCFLFSLEQCDPYARHLDVQLTDSTHYISQELPFINSLYEKEHSYNVLLMLHHPTQAPVFLDSFSISHEKNVYLKLSLEIESITIRRISTPKQQCKEQPFSRKECINLCVLKKVAKEVGCRLPYLRENDLPLCNSSKQYKLTFKQNKEPSANTREICEQTCGIECETVYLKLKATMLDKNYGINEKTDISIRKPVFSTMVISEQLKTSLFSFISGIGGIMGLYLGVSLVDLIAVILWPMAYVLKRKGSYHYIISSSAFKLVKSVFFIIISFLLGTFFLERLKDFVIEPKTYTKYSDQINKWKDFPAVSICRWPPFNLTNLISLGFDFNIDEYCHFDNVTTKYHCSGSLDEFMNDLPGLENKSLSMIWEQTSHNLSDVLYAYTFNGEHYEVASSTSIHWKAITTSLNRCFVFTSQETETEANDLVLYLSRTGFNLYYFNTRPTVEKIIKNPIGKLKSHLAHNLIRIHAPLDEPKTNDIVASYPLYLASGKHHLRLTATLIETDRIDRQGQRCREHETYSQFNCIQECLLHEIVQQEGCKLPFISSFDADECNMTSYKIHFKYLDKMATKLENYKRKKSRCTNKCLPSCKTLSYEIHEDHTLLTDSISYPNAHTQVTVRMKKASHDVYEEVPALSLASFVAEVGGLAGILTGVSLLTLLQFLLTAFIQLYSRINN